jgi:uncharacterized protein YfaS (alpha-2-macroglobulin family)
MLRTIATFAFALMCSSALTQQVSAQQPPAPQSPLAVPFAHAGAQRDAVRYEAQLKAALPAGTQGRRARDLRTAGEKLLPTDPRGATKQLTIAAVLDPVDWETWLSLSRAILAIKPETEGQERYELPVNAAAAAYIAYQRAPIPAAKARALAQVGETFRRRQFWRPAIDALSASLIITDNAQVRATYEKLRAEHGFRMMDYTVENEAQDPRLCIQFSERLPRGETDLSRFIAIDGKPADNLTGEGRQVCVEGLGHGKRYEIVLRAGLPSEIGETLSKPAVVPVYVRDRSPTVRFSGKSYVLPSRGQQGLPVVSINASRLGIEVYRVNDRNLTSVTNSSGDFMKQLSGSDVATLAAERGSKIYSGELEVTPKLNAEVTTAVPIGEAIPELKPGVYAMVARALDKKGRNGDDGETSTQWFIVSDLGLAAFTGDNGLHAFVRSLASTEPINGAAVKVVARNNEVLAQGKTDGAGYVRFEPGLVRGEGGLQPALLIAETANGQYAFLDVASGAFDLSDRGVKGREKADALDAFLFADRGVYRPGETVRLNALVRDKAGAASAVPATLIVTRPDGVEHSRIAVTDQGLGGRAHDLRLSGTAMTGTWRAKLHTDPKADPLSGVSFLVEDFVPERLELKLTPAQTALTPEVPGTINVAGRYLYGPPAANLAAEGEVVVKAGAKEVAGFPGYRFGLADEKITAVRKSLENVPGTNAKGELPLEVLLPPIPRTAQPLTAEVMVRLREPGGRAIERKVTMPVDPKLPRVGIKPGFAGDSIGEGETASFDVIMLDEGNRRLGGKRLAWTLYRLESSWQWYRRDDSWQYDSVTLTRKAGNGLLDSQTDTPARIVQKLDTGRYRLEVTSTEPGGPMSSFLFSTGWYGGEAADTPEMLDVALDKPLYKAGDTAKLKVASRQGGKLLVTVLGSGLVTHRTLDLPNGGGEVSLDVGRDWGPGAYVSASLYRPLDEKARRMPSRAIGLKWLQVDQSERTLNVQLSAPEKIGSGSRLSVPLKIDGLARGEDARVTVAAVDVGILNLTRFEAPKPEGWLYAQTKLGTEIRDLYGRLIDGMRAERGKLRSGGDDSEGGGGMSMSGTPPVETLLALHSGIVRVGADGTARVDFDLPEFNGQVRLMAVAWSGAKVGHGVKDVIVRDPVALTASTPRFLTLGDEARFDLSLHNVEGIAGAYTLAINALPLDGSKGEAVNIVNRGVALKTGERRSERLTVKPMATGLQSYDVRVTGPGGIDVKRRLTLDVKVPGGDIKRVTVAKLAPRTGRITVSKDMLADLLPGRTAINVNVGPVAAFDVPGLLTQLDRYPYGCAEQTTSRALPLLYANDMASKLGLRADANLKERVQGAIDRVLEMQTSSGAFGIWGPRNPDMWLTAYITDFLTRAKEAGFEVKPIAFTSALDRLQSFVSYASDFEKGGEDRAYALYVLTRNGRAPVGELRYYADTRLERFSTSLAKAQLGASLAMIGEKERAERAFRAALDLPAEKTSEYRADYGSRVRDGAAMITLASETRVLSGEVPQLAGVLAKAFAERTYTSTQEQAWMLLAARALTEQTASTELNVGGVAHKGQLMRRLTGPELMDGQLVITNESDAAVDAVVSIIGAALTPEPAVEKGFKIDRSYYTLDGKKVDLKSAQGGTGMLAQNDRLVVVVKVDATDKGGRVLLVDRLPAGLEIENPRIIESADLKSMEWLKTTARPEHTEFRDDRFVAAFNFSGRTSRSEDDDDDDAAKKGPVASATVAYMVRAVTPGSFLHPAATVEDMYRPERYARSAAGRLTVTAKE